MHLVLKISLLKIYTRHSVGYTALGTALKYSVLKKSILPFFPVMGNVTHMPEVIITTTTTTTDTMTTKKATPLTKSSCVESRIMWGARLHLWLVIIVLS